MKEYLSDRQCFFELLGRKVQLKYGGVGGKVIGLYLYNIIKIEESYASSPGAKTIHTVSAQDIWYVLI